jgi:HK97 gp10 family phage protein
MKNIEISLTDNSDLIKDALEDQVEQALIAVGITAENNAKREITHAVYDTPESKSGYVRTGRLRNSLTHEVSMNEKAVYIGSAVKYAPYVENGTMKMPARPYLRPAIVNNVNEYKNLVKQALSR